MNEHVGSGLNGIFDMKNGIIKGFFLFRNGHFIGSKIHLQPTFK